MPESRLQPWTKANAGTEVTVGRGWRSRDGCLAVLLLALWNLLGTGCAERASSRREVSGIYPHLAMFNEEDECGTGAVVPWADRLWVVTYAPHKPLGSTDKLYEITPALDQVIRPESIGGTPANRMIHRESRQLFLGPYAIGADRSVRTLAYTNLFGRPTGMARHLTDPAGKICYATMEEGIYEVDVNTLAVTELWADEQRASGRHADLPGYHGKGFYSAQGRYVYANNGDHAPEALTNPAVPSGVLAEWDGRAERWTIVRRNQFTDVTGPGGIEGNTAGDDRLWTIGWDHRSLLLLALEDGRWSAFRLPKPSHAYDGAHGWNTEWPRIRDIGEADLLMTMHGGFWRFPRAFSAGRSAGLAPRSTYLKVVGDFCRWGNRVVLGCDDTARSEFINRDRIKGRVAPPGRSQSNLWFVEPSRLDALGPALGRGAVWLNDDVQAGVPSDPFLFGGFTRRSLHLAHASPVDVTFRIEVDARGSGQWRPLREITVPARGNAWTDFGRNERGAWVRLTANHDAAAATAFFHFRGDDARNQAHGSIFRGLATLSEPAPRGGLLHVRGGESNTLRVLVRAAAGVPAVYDLDGELTLNPVAGADAAPAMEAAVAVPEPLLTPDAASVLYVDGGGRRWRLPRGDTAFDRPGPMGRERLCREVSTERNLLNVHGTFYELPAENAGGFSKLRPIASHTLRVQDFTSYRGLLVMTGVPPDARGDRIVRSADGVAALWVGSVDDLWQLGKPRGTGGPWRNASVKAGVPSDPYLATGYDRKRLTLSHLHTEPVPFRVEADFTGTGTWAEVVTLRVAPGRVAEHQFPDAFGAYWLRLVAGRDTTATAIFQYD